MQRAESAQAAMRRLLAGKRCHFLALRGAQGQHDLGETVRLRKQRLLDRFHGQIVGRHHNLRRSGA